MATKPAAVKEDYNLYFLRLFHCFLRHSRTEEELRRSKDTWAWMMDNVVSLRTVCVDIQLDMLNIIWTLAMENQDLPGYDLVLEKAQEIEKNTEILDALKGYKEFEDSLNVHQPEDYPALFADLRLEWEKARVTNLLKITNRIVNGSVEEGKRKLSGPHDGVAYLVRGLEEGVLLTGSQSVHPIVVQKDPNGVIEYYEEMSRRGELATGFDEFLLQPGNFMGILGYAGDGKSTLMRYILYKIAESGKNVLEISLENDAAVERNKFILLHAHNPKFGGEFNSLTYEKYKRHQLSYPEREMLAEVGKDFKKTIGGIITIQQPQTASWAHCKTIIENQSLDEEVDAVGVDYLQLIDPPSVRNEGDQRARMTAMVKDVRQYGLTFRGSKKLAIISPVQGNEDGVKKARENEGVWSLSGINNDKEFARSMDFIVGVSSRGKTKSSELGDVLEMVFSCVKERDGVGFSPVFGYLTGTGYICPQSGRGPKSIPIEQPDLMDDIPDDKL